MKTLSDNIKPILAVFIVLSWSVYCFLMSILHPEMSREIFTSMTPVVMIAVGYYLGTSTGASKKDETISDLAKKQ